MVIIFIDQYGNADEDEFDDESEKDIMKISTSQAGKYLYLLPFNFSIFWIIPTTKNILKKGPAFTLRQASWHPLCQELRWTAIQTKIIILIIITMIITISILIIIIIKIPVMKMMLNQVGMCALL